MKTTIGKYWHVLIIGILVILLVLSRCGKGSIHSTKSDTSTQRYIKVDTSYTDSLIVLKQYIVKTIERTQASKGRLDSFSKESKNYDSLKGQYNNLKEKYLAYNRYKDTIGLPYNGYIAIEDVISENEIKSRTPKISLKQQTITIHDSSVTTITKTQPPKRQVYVGGEITGNLQNYINGLNGIIMYKDRKDRVYQAKAGLLNYNNQPVPQFGFGMLIKIHK